MNVYFCDVCGVRVTDTDLHAGHGMRRRNDVICAACLELGHGKGLFAQDGQKQMAMAGAESGGVAAAGSGSNGKHAATAAPAPTPGARNTASDLLAEARDRARTLDEDQPSSPVQPITVLPAPPPGLEAHHEADAAAETAPPAEGTPEFEDTAKVPVVHQELAAAAAGFAALNPPTAKHGDTSAEDVVEVPPSKLDDTGSAAVVALRDGDHGDAEKAETAISGKIEVEPSSSTSGQAPARRQTSSSRVSKQAKSRSARRGKANHNQALLVLSGMATLCLIIFGYILFSGAGAHKGNSDNRQMYSPDNDLKQAISDANAAVSAAQSSQNAEKARHAISLINAVRDQANSFERVAKAHGWTDDQVDDKMTSDGVQQVMGMRKLCEDILVKSQENASP